MQNSIGRDQSVIPFQNTNIAKVAYEQHLRNQDKREREQYRREQEFKANTEGMYQNLQSVPKEFRQKLQSIYDESLGLAQRLEQGEDVYDEFRESKEMFNAIYNSAAGANTFFTKAINDVRTNPDKYNQSLDEILEGYNTFWSTVTPDDIRDPKWLQDAAVDIMPTPKTKVSDYLDYNKISIYDDMLNSEKYVNRRTTITDKGKFGKATLNRDATKAEIVKDISRRIELDPDVLDGVVGNWISRNGKEYNEQSVRQAVQALENPTTRELAIDAWADGMTGELEKRIKSPVDVVDLTTEKESSSKGFTLNIGGKDYNTSVPVDFVVARKNNKDVGRIASFTGMKKGLFNINGKMLPVQIARLEYDRNTGKYKAYGFGYTESKSVDDGWGDTESGTEPTEPVVFEPTITDLKKINNLAGAPIYQALTKKVRSVQGKQQETQEATIEEGGLNP